MDVLHVKGAKQSFLVARVFQQIGPDNAGALRVKLLATTRRAHFLAPLLATLIAASGSAAVVTWTNTSGGDWSLAANWSPNQVPGASDTADITTAGSYTVTFDTNAMIAGLVLGGDSGTQTFLLASNTLTLNGTAIISSNGAFELSGGVLGGTNGVIAGLLTWLNGWIAAGSTLTLATNGTLMVTGTNGTSDHLYGTLTNAGTVRLASGNLFSCGVLINLPGAPAVAEPQICPEARTLAKPRRNRCAWRCLPVPGARWRRFAQERACSWQTIVWRPADPPARHGLRRPS